ncbi:uncharacterized protein DFL_008879 [Arthrobotrys flagrans]|uniref:Uncharacterized protein n=1 Tax=Arthrobotrys flagrans TaxID=97331 RepID=A0A436ZQ16_ARTFL|nr:hypothetical protein DFL_008879 [Arthrobotrys flagrans]
MSSYADKSFSIVQDSGERPLPDVWDGKIFFPPVGEVFPPEIRGTANSFRDADLEAARRGYITLNKKDYEITYESLNNLELFGFNVDGLRSALRHVRREELEAELADNDRR